LVNQNYIMEQFDWSLLQNNLLKKILKES